MKRIAGVLVLAVMLAGGAASEHAAGHGASRGLHLHVTPDPARPGALLEIELNAARRVTSARVSVEGRPPRSVVLDAPARRVTLEIRLPRRVAKDAVNVQAEARTPAGTDLRASAIVRILDAPDADETGPGRDPDQGGTGSRSNASAAPLPSAATTHGSVGLTPKP